MSTSIPHEFPAAQAPGASVLVPCAITDRPSKQAFKPYSITIGADVAIITKRSSAQRQQRPHASRRSAISCFSRKSRKRMIVKLALIRDVTGGYVITVTYPDDVPHSGEKAKRDLAALRKRLARRFPTVGGIWRIEMKPRLSGQFVGQLAPHFHLLVFGWQQRQQLVRMWVQLAWSRIVYESDKPPRLVRTSATVLHNRRHASRYASKYAAKEETLETLETGEETVTSWGRRWGSFGALNFAPAVTLDLSSADVIALRRTAARWLKSRGSRYAKRLARGSPEAGFSIFGLGDQSNLAAPGAPTIFRMLYEIQS